MKNNSSKPRRRSLDPSDLLSNTAHWPPLTAIKAEQKNLTAGDWMEKVMMKQKKVNRSRSVENFGEENRKSTENCHPEYHQPDENSLKQPFDCLEVDKKDCQDNDSQLSMFDLITPDSIDELEIATSDSSEQEFQLHLPRVASLPNGMGSKIKRPTPLKTSKSPEKRYSFIFSPAILLLSEFKANIYSKRLSQSKLKPTLTLSPTTHFFLSTFSRCFISKRHTNINLKLGRRE